MRRWRSNSNDGAQRTTTTVRRYKVAAPTHSASPVAPRRTTYHVSGSGNTEMISSSGGRHYDVMETAAANNMALVYKKDWTRERAEREFVPTTTPNMVVQRYERPVVRYEKRERERYMEPPPIAPLPRQEVAHHRHRYRQRSHSRSRSRSISDRERSHSHYRRHTLITRRGSSASDYSYYSDGERRQKRTLAEGALAGAGITALMQSRRDDDGELPENRGSKVLAGAALGALGAEALRRAQSAHPHDRPCLRSALGVGAAALALAGTATMMKTRKEDRDVTRGRSQSRIDIRRYDYSRSRSRTRSRSRSISSRESSLERRYRHRRLSLSLRPHLGHSRGHSIAKIAAGTAAGTAATTAIAHHIRHRDRSRSLSSGYDSYSDYSDSGRRRHHHKRRSLAKIAAGTAAATAISHKIRSRSRSRCRSYESDSDRGRHARQRPSLTKIAAGTAATAAIAHKLRRSRSRGHSLDSYSGSSDETRLHRKRPSVAKIAAGTVATAAIARKLRSRSRSRSRSITRHSRSRSHSKSRLRTGAEIAGAGVAGLGAAKLFNKVRHGSSSRSRSRSHSRFSLRRLGRRKRDHVEKELSEDYYSDNSLSRPATRRERELQRELKRERARSARIAAAPSQAHANRLVDPNPTFSVVSLPDASASNLGVHETVTTTRERTEVSAPLGVSSGRLVADVGVRPVGQLEYDNRPAHIPGISRMGWDRVDTIPALQRARSRSRSVGRPINFRRAPHPDEAYESDWEDDDMMRRRRMGPVEPPMPRRMPPKEKESHKLRNITAATIGAGAAAIGLKKLSDERERSRERERDFSTEREERRRRERSLERDLQRERERVADLVDLTDSMIEEDRGRSRERQRGYEDEDRWSDRSLSRERGMGERGISPGRERSGEENVPPSQRARQPSINESSTTINTISSVTTATAPPAASCARFRSRSHSRSPLHSRSPSPASIAPSLTPSIVVDNIDSPERTSNRAGPPPRLALPSGPITSPFASPLFSPMQSHSPRPPKVFKPYRPPPPAVPEAPLDYFSSASPVTRERIPSPSMSMLGGEPGKGSGLGSDLGTSFVPPYPVTPGTDGLPPPPISYPMSPVDVPRLDPNPRPRRMNSR